MPGMRVIRDYIFTTWHDHWDGGVANKLHSVKPGLGDWQSSYSSAGRMKLVCVVPE